MAQSEVKMRWVRNVATGKVTAQSSNATRKLLGKGGYIEVSPPDGSTALKPLNVVAPKTKAASGTALLLVAVGCFLTAAVALAAIYGKAKGIY